MMYVHTPFPNKVYALDLSQENKIVWKYEPKQDPNVIPVMCCDTVNRGVTPAINDVIAATNGDLESMIARREFRELMRPAMLKADPSIQPILDKLRAERQGRWRRPHPRR